jgi:lipoprotein-anchoring transpeptidase ErfK/SrfK
MALASQSIPTNDRRRVTFSKRRVITPPLIAAIVVAGGIVLAGWWLLSGGDDGADGGVADEGLVINPGAPERTPPAANPAANPIVTPPANRTSGTAPRIASDPTIPSNPSTAGHGAVPERPSLRALVAEDRAAGEVGREVGRPAIEMGATQPGTVGQNPPASTPPASATPSGSAPGAPLTAPPATTPPPAAPPPQPPKTAPQTTAPAVANDRPITGPVSHADLARAMQLQSSDPVAARALVTRVLDEDRGGLSRADRDRGYELVNALGRSLLLNTNINPNDPFIRVHSVQPGESLAKIVRSQGLACETLLLKRINGIRDERRIQIGQKLRIPKGAFHAEVIKAEYRLNLYLDAGAGSSERVMVASLRCGLGESGGTPTGLFRVRPKSKLIDPEWTHPKTGEYFASHDPKNPIGEHWIGIVGVEESNKDLLGYGIHGTVEPDSIGQDRSLGCVRMLADDVAFVYECLVEPHSTIRIR